MMRQACHGAALLTAAILASFGHPAMADDVTLATAGDGAVNARQTKQAKGKQVTNLPDSMLDALNPAQRAYGLPKNPGITFPVDPDLKKPLSLARAISLGLALQNSIAISQSSVDQAAARLTQSKSSFFPQVTPSYHYDTSLTPTKSYKLDPITGLPIQRLSNQSVGSTSQTATIAATQLIYDMGQREATVSQSKRSLFAAEYGLADQRQSVILNISQDYYNLLRYRELIKEDEKSRDRYKTTLEIVTTQATVGTAAKSDVYQPKADLANAEVTLLQDKSNYQVAEATLKNAMGIVSGDPVVLPELSLPAPASRPDPNPLNIYLQLAYKNRLDIKQQQENVYAQGYALRLARIQAGITLNATITEGYAGEPVSGEERSVNLTLSYPLFDGGNTRAAVRASAAALEQQKRSLDQLEQTIRLDVEQSFEVREIARQRVVAAQVAVTSGDENLTVVREKEKNQLAGLPDIIAAETQRDAAGVSLVQAIYDYYVATAALQRAVGVNDPTFLPRVPKAPHAQPAPAEAAP